MTQRLSERLHLGPAPWPGAGIDPSDLTKFVPNGLGLGTPNVMMPWDSLDSFERRGGFYGFDQPTGHPLRDAPTNVAEGGIVYLDDNVAQADFEALLRLLGIYAASKEYAAIYAESQNPSADRAIDQLRIVSKSALAGLFEAPLPGGDEKLVNQPLSIGEAMWGFIVDQQEYWGSGMSPKLDGMLGGDGDWAKESLAFGVMVENSYRAVYRIWSRAWLVTK